MPDWTRREWAGMLVAGAATAATPPEVHDAIVQRHDAAVQDMLKRQVTDPSSRWAGGVASGEELYHAGSASGIVNYFAAAFLHPQSRFYRDATLVQRYRLAMKFLERGQSPDGNISLLITNFNSPPDTGFIVHNVAEAASIGRKYGVPEVERAAEPFLKAAARGMMRGGIHTPNHRWVICAALAQIHELYPELGAVRRIDEWLAEGIDLDEDGQFIERSAIYSEVCDRSFVMMAKKLKRPELLEPARRNLATLLYLLHANGEVVTEISRRQDLNQREAVGRFWFPIRALAVADANGQLAMIAREVEAKHARLAALMDYPEIANKGPDLKPLPDNYDKTFRAIGLTRIRRGPTSASILLGGTSRFLSVHHGDAVLEAVRMASAFFGKGQFIPNEWRREGEAYLLEQKLEAGYYQPVKERVTAAPGQWGAVRATRRVSEPCTLHQSASVTRTATGFRLRLRANGTDGVPLTVELGFREGGRVEGCEPVQSGRDGWLLRKGTAVYRSGLNTITIEGGVGEHAYVDVRGAEAKLPGPTVYLTGYTPFDHTFEIKLS